MVYRRKFTKKLTPQHQEFINKYLHSKYNRSGLYKLIYFCEDEDIAIVIRYNDYYDTQDAWGCVNMSNQLLVPFEYRRIWDYGRFLIARKSFEAADRNKNGTIDIKELKACMLEIAQGLGNEVPKEEVVRDEFY